MDGTLRRVEFTNCRMSGLQATGLQAADVGFTGCRLDGTNFRMSRWQRAEFADCDLRDADLYSSTAPEARFVRCDLRSALISKASLAGAVLSGSRLDGIRGAESLRGVIISHDQLIPAAEAVFSALGITLDDGAA